MIKLIVGTKGTGKTKTLIEMAKKAAEESKGNVVCVVRHSGLCLSVRFPGRLPGRQL